jgi:hypothetical protein
MLNEINLDELKSLAKEAQANQKKKNELEAEKVIYRIPMKARHAAREGKTSMVAHSSRTADPVSEIVFDWCVKQGLNPKWEEDIRDKFISYKGEHVEEVWTNIVIYWGD